MIKTIKKTIEKIISLWNIYGGIILSTFIAWLTNFSKDSMDNITSYLVMTLTCISVLTFFKLVLFKKKSSGVVDGITLNQSSIKAMKTAINPLETGKEIGTTIIQTKNMLERLGTKIMNWISKNKGAIIGVVSAVLGTLELCFNFVGQYLPQEIGFNVVSVLYYGIGTIISVLTTGFGTPAFKEKISMLKDQLNGDKTDLQYINDKKYLKRQISVYAKAVEQVEKEKTSLSTNYLEIINDYESCSRLGLSADNETISKYSEFQEKLSNIEAKLSMKKDALVKYQEKLKELENLISNENKTNTNI